MRGGREKRLIKITCPFFSLSSLLGVKKKKRYFSLMSVEDQEVSEKDFGYLSCVAKKIWSYKCKDSQGYEKGPDRR